jgi:hypothetical protein
MTITLIKFTINNNINKGRRGRVHMVVGTTYVFSTYHH